MSTVTEFKQGGKKDSIDLQIILIGHPEFINNNTEKWDF